ncbi:hypothetical protein Goari_003173, partial [Gossypium aridum]|nr:hypothetical protein [Gossypium aridum]
MKFNVCGIANEKVTGCGGVLIDIEGVARALFSGPIAVNDIVSVKVGVVFISLDYSYPWDRRLMAILFLVVSVSVGVMNKEEAGSALVCVA